MFPEMGLAPWSPPRTDQVSQPPHGVILGQLVQYAGLAQARQDMPSVLVFLLGNAGLCPIQEHLSRDSLLLAEARGRGAVISDHQRQSTRRCARAPSATTSSAVISDHQRQSTRHTADLSRRPQTPDGCFLKIWNHEPRITTRYPTTPTAPTAPSRHVLKKKHEKNRQRL